MLHRYSGIALAFLLSGIILLTACGPGDKNGHGSSVAVAGTVPAAPNPIAGKKLSQSCVACHGEDGVSSKNGAPFIAGQQPEYIKAALKAYANGHRSNEFMNSSVGKLKASDRENLAAYYSSLNATWNSSVYKSKPKPTGKVSQADIARGKKIAGPCLSCHGEDGNSKQAGIPSLAGISPDYLHSALKAYFDKTRNDPVMQTFSRSITNSQSRQLAAYLSILTRKKAMATVSGNIKRGKRYSRKACVACHGGNGNSLNPKIPSLSGQNAAYLVKAMEAYHDGKRKNAMMQSALKGVPHKYYVDIATYYAAQQPKKLGAIKAVDASNFDPIGDGASLASTCNGCHGNKGNSVTAGVPSLTRLYPVYLKTAIAEYKSGTRKHALMKSFVTALSEDDIEKLSLYYATQAPKKGAKPRKGDAKAAEQISLTCAGCHGEHGNSQDDKVPSLAGQNSQYITNALKAYANGSRQQKDMQKVVKELKPSDYVNLAAYYTVQTPKTPKVSPPENPIELSAKCDRCHGENGFSAVLDIPRIGGQLESYLVHSLNAYKSGKRTNSAMHAMSDVLSNLEIKAIAHYYSQQTKSN